LLHTKKIIHIIAESFIFLETKKINL
jgi:hypothetical protein